MGLNSSYIQVNVKKTDNCGILEGMLSHEFGIITKNFQGASVIGILMLIMHESICSSRQI